MPGVSSCGDTVDNLCKTQIVIPKKFAFYFILLLRLKTNEENILIVILSIRTRDHLDREAFGWNGPVDREAFGRNGLPGGKVFGPTSPADREVQGGTFQRVGRSSGQTLLRIATPGSIGYLDHDVFGRIGPLKRKIAKPNGPGRGVRSALRSTLHGPRVRALDASFLLAARWEASSRKARATRPYGVSRSEQQPN